MGPPVVEHRRKPVQISRLLLGPSESFDPPKEAGIAVDDAMRRERRVQLVG